MNRQAMEGRAVVLVAVAALCVAVLLAAWGVRGALRKKAQPQPVSADGAGQTVLLGRPLSEPQASEKPDLIDLHGREDLLLENYTWADAAHTRVRIPIERAMELTAARGIPVEEAKPKRALLRGEKPLQASAPLTTGYEPTALDPEK